MSRNGAGIYSPSATGYPAVASTTIESAKFNAVVADIATALTLSIAANGETTITANIPLAGYKITGLGNASADTDALNRVTADARYALVTAATFTAPVQIFSATPYLDLRESDAPNDEQFHRIVVSDGTFYLQFLDDGGANAVNPLVIARTGTTVDSITFAGTTIAITGNGTVSGTLSVTSTLTVSSIDITPTAGTFTIYLRASNNGADLASGTATYKKMNGVVYLEIPLLSTTNSTAVLYLDNIPAAIQKTGTASQLIAHGLDAGANAVISVQTTVGVDYWQINPANGTGFTATATGKGIYPSSLVYIL